MAARQQITQQWWESRRAKFDLYASQFVVREAGAGDAIRARKRLDILDGIALLAVGEETINRARSLVQEGPMPEKAEVDALHISLAASHGMDYLLTWNCKHIANAEMQTGIARLCRAAGCEPPVICTPEELLGSD